MSSRRTWYKYYRTTDALAMVGDEEEAAGTGNGERRALQARPEAHTR